jgi:RNase H-fold protein (predicted Holliday junction resolvase)
MRRIGLAFVLALSLLIAPLAAVAQRAAKRIRRVLFALVSAASFRNPSVGVPDPASNLSCPL